MNRLSGHLGSVVVNRGSLVNAQHGRQLHPQSAAVAGGMTYRPPTTPGGVEQRPARLFHKQEVVGPNPAPAPTEVPEFCPCLNKRGGDCGSKPLPETGICREHSQKIAAGLAIWFGC